MLTKKNKIILITSLLLFSFLLPLSQQINFYQNDDWVYYQNVKIFMEGDLQLDEYMGPTFYAQGFLGLLFSRIFSIENLPTLTLFFGILNFFIFSSLINRFLNFTKIHAILFGLLFLFNPLSLYLLWGFMSGHYFLFFLLASLYLFLDYQQKKSSLKFVWIILLSFAALFVRQVALVIPLSFSLWYLLKKEYKVGLIFLAIFSIMSGYLAFVFPTTRAMKRASLQFAHFLDFDYTFSLILGIMLVLVSFTLPLMAYFLFEKFRKFNHKERIVTLLMGVVIYALLIGLYKPETISWGEFPYFENTFERTGFYPRGISGTKYHFAGNFDLFMYWDLFSKVLLSLFLAYLVFDYRNVKKYFNIYLLLFVIYTAVMAVTETFYDRYLVVLIPLGILYLLKITDRESNKELVVQKLLLVPFLAFLLFFGYQLSSDFIQTNKYVWERSWQVVDEEKIFPGQVKSTHAWNSLFFDEDPHVKYIFSFDSPEISEEYNCCYDLLEVKEINYPLNIFVNPKVYLYKEKAKLQ